MASDHHPATTFVQANPSNFRAVVQRLTGATPPESSSSSHKHPIVAGDISHRRSGFNLHERRQTTGKLEITLNRPFGIISPSSARQRSFAGGEMMMSSPVSTLDVYGRGSPRTPVEEEERAIAEKGFYLHPSPLNTPRGSEPELLVLFPLRSPKTDPSSSSS
ncbi:VQ motif-containing protein 11-like [Cynara cardunculus var. scolymus]|uniref:VQ-like protein n=1 Tax=Cynara cardunculus var. scolymus TaxID=59895 RepID=A0A103XWD7_CYNCS|nr:VQ motif-containing protein 11-like [Cynara cardunculus var. scolymus]KVH98041.1 VQ-like protein [Cynara cardunculus var. scolymus]